MLFSEDVFFHALDEGIPELARARELFDGGDLAGAEAAFAAYLKTALRADLYLPERMNPNPTREEREAGIAHADRICGGEVSSTGLAYVFKDNVFDWEVNPTFNGYREWTWQLSRHPEFVTLAQAYEWTGDEKYARQYVHMITSWIDQCICPESISGYATKTWRTIEAGIRMLGSWHIAIHTFLKSPSVDAHVWTQIFRSVYEHVYRLRGFRTSHNWLIMEMGGLVNIAVLYPFFRDAKEWFDDGMQTLEKELYVQLYPDDFQYELTTGYHGCNIGNYNNVIALCHTFGIPVPESFGVGVHRMYDLYPKLCRPDLYVPSLNDGGEFWVPGMAQKALRAYPDDAVFKWFATERKEGTPPAYLSTVMPYSGLVVMRTGWDEGAIWGFLDGGPFGFAHQHEDKLNFELYAYGASMLPDAGSYAYDVSAQRAYILSTRSHNTGLVDGFGQRRREFYKWNEEDIEKKATELSYRKTEDYEIAASSYTDGYGTKKVPDGRLYPEFADLAEQQGEPFFVDATHTRKVIFFRKGWRGIPPFFVLLDDFTAKEGKHSFEVSFQLTADPTSVENGKTVVRFANGASLSLISCVYPTLTVGQYEPEYMGWRSIHAQGAHEHQPAAVVRFAKSGEAAQFATLVLPRPDGEVPDLKVTREPESFTLTTGETSETFELSLFDTDPV